MRSGRLAGEEQGQLPFDLPPAIPAAVGEVGEPDDLPVRRSRPAPASPSAADRGRYRLRNDALASLGWPAGTELMVAPGRPQRGQVALVEEGGRLKVGVFDRQLGRGVLRTDRGSLWLGASARFIGVVTLVGAPLAGMPDIPA